MSSEQKPSLKQKLRNHELTIGTWITLGHPAIAEIFAKAGYDWLTIDMEHSAIDLPQAKELIRIADLCGVTPMVRLTSNNREQIKRVMDSGAHGIIVPNVNTAAEAEAAYRSMQYPPIGVQTNSDTYYRGVGLARAHGYGTNFAGYMEFLKDESVLIVQIEHIDAVNNFEEIVSVEGVDGFILGPYDLSASMGLPGQFDHPDVVAAIQKVEDEAKRLKVPGGIHVVEPKIDELEKAINRGFTFVAYSLDTRMLDVAAREGVAFAKQAKAQS